MSVRNQASESLELADLMKSLQSQSPSPPPLLDSDIQFGSLEDSIETQLRREFGLADKEQDLQLDNPVMSQSVCLGDALKSFCVGMDGKGFWLFLYEHIDVHDSMCDEVRDALSHAPDPAKLVLDAIPCYLRVHPGFDKPLLLSKVRKSCIILLEQLMAISPQISPHVEEEALKIADEWRAKLGKKFRSPVVVYGFLLFVAAYGLRSKYHADELLDHFGIANQYKASPGLCQVLGLEDKVEVLIRTLIQKTMLLEAIDNIYAYQLVHKFQPVRLLKGYLKFNKKIINKKPNKSVLQQTQAIDKEIVVLRTIIKYVTKYKLESEHSPVALEKQISKLEEQKVCLRAIPITPQTKKKKADMKPNVIIPSPASGSTVPNSEEKIDSPLKEDVQLDNQMASESTSPWPKLETFCESNDGIGLKFLFNEHVEEQGSTSNSSTYPWPELKTFCVCMDGRSLRLFLCDHVEEHDSMCNEVREALLLAPDPEKLVLDAIAGFLRLQPEFDNSISLSKVRKSCILLLEQLITICPQISATVQEEASKMADEWRANLGEKYQNPVIVYGFLHFVAAYGFTSNYKSDELLVLLATANQYKVCPGLCPILGLVDKVAVLIENLKQKNLLHEAIEHIYAFEVADKFKLVSLLKDYLTCSKKKIYEKGNKSLTQLDQAHAIGKEIVVWKTVRSCVTKYNLKSEYPLKKLDKDISELENRYFVELEVLIENLKQKNLLHEAIEHISAFEVADKYKLVSLLKDYLTYSKKKICKKGNKSFTQLDQAHAIGKEIVVLRMVKSCITKYNLESEYPLQELEKDISELENCYFVKLEVLIKNLKQKNLLREDKFKLVSLLKDYLTYSKKKLYEKGDKSLTQLDQAHAIGKEIVVLRMVKSCITKYNLESEYPLQELEKDISELENRYFVELEVLIENLKQKNLLHEAIEHISAFEVADKYKLVILLKDYLTCLKKKIYEKGNKSLTQLDQAHAIGKGIVVLRAVRSCIAKYNLESEYSPLELEKDISEMENCYFVKLEGSMV